MRFQKKYKPFNLQYKNRRLDIPVRILKFNRSKWSTLLFYIQNRRRLSSFFYLKKKLKSKKYKNILSQYNFKKPKINYLSRLSFNNFLIRVSLKRWDRIENVPKRALFIQRSYRQLYDNNLAYKQMKRSVFQTKDLSKRITFLKSLAQFEFRLDILLWRFRFFKNTNETRFFINSGLVKVNFKKIKGNYLLKPGDIISFDGKLNFLSNLKRLKKTFLDSSFLEIDFFTNTIVIVDSFDNPDILKNSFLMKQYFNIDLFRYSLR